MLHLFVYDLLPNSMTILPRLGLFPKSATFMMQSFFFKKESCN